MALWLRVYALTAFCAGLVAAPANLEELRKSFETPPDDARIMMRWWWFGPSVTKPQLEREMRLMKEGGIGGFEVQPVYPLSPDDPSRGVRNLQYLSDEFIDALKFTAEKARELGLRFDLTIGSGWPYGGPQIPVTQAAGRLRVERVKVPQNSRRVPVPSTGAGEKLIAAFGPTSGSPGAWRELNGIRDGVLWLPEGGEKPAEVAFFISSRTGMMVKRPAYGAEGYVLDHYDRTAIDNYLHSVGDRLLQAFGTRRPHAIFCDSLEVFASDWTSDLLDEFRKRRGYDLKPHLPALVTDIGPRTADIRHDWGKTLTELLEDRFLTPMRDWSKKNRTQFRIQGYGIPPAVVSSNSYADIPEGEGSHWRIVRASRWAASASHLYGKPVTTSETWTWLHSPVFRATPLDVKVEADLHFLQGINQLIGHGWPYAPQGEAYPGWRFYAAGVFNDKNPWWIAMPDLARYLQRVSHLLRQGKPANDVALYLPNSDAWSSFTAGRVHMIDVLRERVGAQVMGQILDAGYGLDFFDDRTLDHVMRLGYRVIVLPGVERMSLATLRKLEEFAGRGGILLATKRTPSTAPGLMTSDSDRAQVREISQRLFEGATARARLVTDESTLGKALNSLLAPDMGLSAVTSDIGFVHRTTDFAEIYFVANVGNTPKNLRATFRVTGREPEWWDATTGAITPVEVLDWANGATTIALDIAPYESRVLVFARHSGPFAVPPALRPIGRPVDISTGWKVTFASGGEATQMETLRSWTDDERTRFYSGTATYEKEVTVPAALIRPDARITLDFGEGKQVAETRLTNGMRAWFDGPVREAAVVYVNGRRAGSVWCPPYNVDVTPLLKPGANQVRIVVANLAVNHMAGRALPDYKLLNLRYGARFEAQDMNKIEPVPSGLLGPIRLIASGVKP